SAWRSTGPSTILLGLPLGPRNRIIQLLWPEGWTTIYRASETWMMRRSGPGLRLWARSRAVRFGMRVRYPQLKRRPAIWPMASLGCIPGVHQGYTKRPVTPCCAVLATQRNASTNPLSLLGFSWNFVLRPVAWCNPSAALRAGKGLFRNGGRGGAAALHGT